MAADGECNDGGTVRGIDWLSKLRWGDEQMGDLRILAYNYLKEGQYRRAVTLFEALVVLRTDHPYDQQTLGALYLQMNEPGKAAEQLRSALELKKSHLPTQLNLAKALLISGEKEEGLALAYRLSKARNRRVRDTAEALIMAYEESPEALPQSDEDLPPSGRDRAVG